MKRNLLLIFLILSYFSSISYSQFTIGFSLPNINVTELKSGDDIIIPVTVIKAPKTSEKGGLCVGHNLYFEFDHNLLEWKGTPDTPLNGVINFSPLCPYSVKDWVFNDNGNFMVCIWMDPNYTGVYFPEGTVLFEYVFTYKGGLKKGESTPLIWTTEHVVVNNYVQKGKSAAFTDKLIPYDDLILLNGSIYSE